MRIIISLVFLAVSLYAIGDRNHWWTPVHPVLAASFVKLHDFDEDAALALRRQQCGDQTGAVRQLEKAMGPFGDRYEYDVEYEQAMANAIEYLVHTGVVSSKCVLPVFNKETFRKLGPYEGLGYVFISTTGDRVIDVLGEVTMSWSKVIQPDSWQPNILLTENDRQLAIDLGNGDPAHRAVWDGMRQMAAKQGGRG